MVCQLLATVLVVQDTPLRYSKLHGDVL